MGLSRSCDFLVIGAGIIGIAIARALGRRYPDSKIVVIEKENHLGEHSSGRNSGVLHAGFYYSAQSLKAKLCRLGNKALTEFCLDRGLPINRCGKLVVAKDDTEIPTLHELCRRGEANGVELKLISEEEAREIEPRVVTAREALWSPTTATVDPLQVLTALKEDLEKNGCEIAMDTSYLSRRGRVVQTSRGAIEARYMINAAGLYADRIARDFGFGLDYRMLPFKGLYLYSDEKPHAMRTNIYPVPFLKNPFLGVHFTVTVDGHLKVGPTAIPVLWMEQYSFFHRFKPLEALDVCLRELGLLFHSDFEFKQLAWQELKKHSKRHLVGLAKGMARGIEFKDYNRWGKPGIRAQLVHQKTKALEMDFILEGDSDSFHVLNAVSPAFTCAIPFGEYIVDQIDQKRCV